MVIGIKISERRTSNNSCDKINSNGNDNQRSKSRSENRRRKSCKNKAALMGVTVKYKNRFRKACHK